MKLIIDIDEKTFKDVKMLSDYGYNSMFNGLVEAISNGTPLEDIKAEIQKEADYLKQQRDYGRAYGMEIVIEYIDNHIKENKQ